MKAASPSLETTSGMYYKPLSINYYNAALIRPVLAEPVRADITGKAAVLADL